MWITQRKQQFATDAFFSVAGQVLVLVGMAAVLTACAGSPALSSSQPSVLSVSVSPVAASLPAGGTQAFTATVTGSSNTAVTWSVQEGAAAGSITSAGVFTASQTAGTYHVLATSAADPSKSATAAVTVTATSPAISVTIAPIAISLPPGGSQTFTATVTGSSNTAVIWSVQEGATAGVITNAGVFTASPPPGVYHVVATSVADPSKSATAAVTVTAPGAVEVSVAPAEATVAVGKSITFAARVTGSTNTAVTWELVYYWDLPGGPLSWGSITNAGVFTANQTLGTFLVAARSVADPSKTGTAKVTIVTSTTTGPQLTGNMVDWRTEHTSTLLPNGKVLVACGWGYSSTQYVQGMPMEYAVPDAEIFDPASGAFTAFAATPRDNCTATLLPNGKVLVAAGWSGSIDVPDVSNTAELYDPASGTFTPTGNLLSARFSHTATLLVDGKVLIAGGEFQEGSGNNSLPATAELYDPVSGMFSAAGAMVTPRAGHTATLLSNGKVLIVGGDGCTPDPQTGALTCTEAGAELYDPATGTFFPTGPMLVPRMRHTATLLPNGKVLIAGGEAWTNNVGTFTTQQELYDPATGTFSPAGKMIVPRVGHTATLLPDGTVLIAGGATPQETVSTEMYDPVTNGFTAAANLMQARSWHSATLLTDGSVLITGGYYGWGVLNSAEIYK